MIPSRLRLGALAFAMVVLAPTGPNPLLGMKRSRLVRRVASRHRARSIRSNLYLTHPASTSTRWTGALILASISTSLCVADG